MLTYQHWRAAPEESPGFGVRGEFADEPVALSLEHDLLQFVQVASAQPLPHHARVHLDNCNANTGSINDSRANLDYPAGRWLRNNSGGTRVIMFATLEQPMITRESGLIDVCLADSHFEMLQP